MSVRKSAGCFRTGKEQINTLPYFAHNARASRSCLLPARFGLKCTDHRKAEHDFHNFVDNPSCDCPESSRLRNDKRAEYTNGVVSCRVCRKSPPRLSSGAEVQSRDGNDNVDQLATWALLWLHRDGKSANYAVELSTSAYSNKESPASSDRSNASAV